MPGTISRECLWICGRGPTRLHCRLCHHAENDLEVEVTRNDRLYGTYRFAERRTALTFAERLRHNLEGNGWKRTTEVLDDGSERGFWTEVLDGGSDRGSDKGSRQPEPL